MQGDPASKGPTGANPSSTRGPGGRGLAGPGHTPPGGGSWKRVGNSTADFTVVGTGDVWL